MLPLYILPIPSCVVQSLNKLGYVYLSDIVGASEDVKEKLRDCLKQYGTTLQDIIELSNPPPIVTATTLFKSEESNESIPTFSQALDEIVGGGVQLKTVYQICGAPGSGKTQIMFQLCVDVQIPYALGGLGGEAIFIDSECAFSMSRIKEIATSTVKHCSSVASVHSLEKALEGFTENSILEGIHYTSVMSHTELLAAVHLIPSFLQSHPKVKLIAIDSLTLPLLGIKKTVERTRTVYTILNQLHSLAIKHSLAVVLVNHMTTRIVNGEKTFAPALGESLPHRTPHVLLLANIEGEFSAVMLKSPYLPKQHATFTITTEGIRDI